MRRSRQQVNCLTEGEIVVACVWLVFFLILVIAGLAEHHPPAAATLMARY